MTAPSTAAVHDSDDRDPVSFGLALAAAAVLGIAAILTAWGSFQASRASGAVERIDTLRQPSL